MQGLQSIVGVLEKSGVSVMAISVDSPEELKTKVESKGITFPLLSDPDLKVIDGFGLRHEDGFVGGKDIARPAVFLIDENGKIVFRILPDNWRVRPTPEDILVKIQEEG